MSEKQNLTQLEWSAHKVRTKFCLCAYDNNDSWKTHSETMHDIFVTSSMSPCRDRLLFPPPPNLTTHCFDAMKMICLTLRLRTRTFSHIIFIRKIKWCWPNDIAGAFCRSIACRRIEYQTIWLLFSAKRSANVLKSTHLCDIDVQMMGLTVSVRTWWPFFYFPSILISFAATVATASTHPSILHDSYMQLLNWTVLVKPYG